VNKFSAYAIMSGALILVYVQSVMMLIELQRMLSHELKHMCSKTTTVLSESMVIKGTDVRLLYFYCIINKYIV